jgi:phi13 family phage major tail protein
MAKIGLTNFWYAKLTEAADGTPSYDGAKNPGKAVSFSFEPTNSNATLYADDALAESDYATTGGNVTLGIDREDPETFAELLGHTYTDGEVVRNTDDTAPYIGIAHVVTLMVDNDRKYKAEILNKVKLSEPTEEANTRGESTEFGTYELTGTATTLGNGNWSQYKYFDTKAGAVDYIKQVFGGAESE